MTLKVFYDFKSFLKLILITKDVTIEIILQNVLGGNRHDKKQ